MFGCQPNIISPDKDLKAVLEFLGSESSKLTNCHIYYARQMYVLQSGQNTKLIRLT